MEHCGTTDADPDSLDLYSRVKLRALNKKLGCVANHAEDSKLANPRSRKFSSGIGQGSSSENVAAQLEPLSRKNDFAVENSSLRTLTEVIVKETNPYYTWRSDNKQMNHQFPNFQNFDMSDRLSDEGTAIEVLDALRKEIPKSSSNKRLDIGDLVWGRVKSYPWWPGQIFDEALASPSVQSNKREGCVLVAFYGDYTYAWLAHREIVPFDINFDENFKQTNVQVFLTGVEEAIAEMKRRVALGLVCRCQNNSNLQPMMMEGNSVKQIQKAREDFHPEEIIYFLKYLALSPRKNVKWNPYWIKNVANVSAYRKAAVRDETYAQDFMKQQKSLECSAGITKENQKASQDPSGLLDAEAGVKTKCFAQLTEVYDLPKKDELNVCLSTKNFEDHELQIGPNDLANAGKKRRILGHVEESGMEGPLRMNKLMYLARFATNQKVLELQGESQAGIRSGSSTQPQKDSQIKQESIRSDVKERTLTIKFPPQTILPSISEVKAKFACLGPLDELSTSFFWNSSTYQLVFLQKSDTIAAYQHAIQNSALFSSTSGVRYFLQASDHDLNESGNSKGLVENQGKIQLTSSLKSNEYAGEPMSGLFHPLLLHPEKNQLKSSIKKLSAEGSDHPSITQTYSLKKNTDNSEIPKSTVPLSFLPNFPQSSTTICTTNEQSGIEQLVEDEAMKKNDSHNTTIANNIDISHQLINLLSRCGGILGELKSAYEHMF